LKLSGAPAPSDCALEAPLLLASVGALLGAGIAWLAFNENEHVFGGTVVHLAGR